MIGKLHRHYGLWGANLSSREFAFALAAVGVLPRLRRGDENDAVRRLIEDRCLSPTPPCHCVLRSIQTVEHEESREVQKWNKKISQLNRSSNRQTTSGQRDVSTVCCHA